MNQEEWYQLAKNIEVLQKEIVRIVDLFLFANQIEPKIFSDLLQIEDEIEAFIKFYYAIPNFYGVPNEQITNKKALKSKTHLYKNMEKYIDNIIMLTTFKTSDGGSYKKWVETTPTYTNGPGSASFTLVDYEVVKNGNYYEILGTTTDGDIMNQVVNTIK